MAKKTSQPARRPSDLRRVQSLTRQPGNVLTGNDSETLGSMSGTTFEPLTATRPAATPAAASAVPAMQRPTVSNMGAAPAVQRPVAPNVVAARDILARQRAATTAATRAARTPTLSREQEYSYVRADLRTVFILTLLMVVAIIVLYFFLH